MRQINQYPFNNFYNIKTHNRIKEIDKEINEEKSQPNSNAQHINKLQEQKLIEGLFSMDQLNCMFGKYRSPW